MPAMHATYLNDIPSLDEKFWCEFLSLLTLTMKTEGTSSHSSVKQCTQDTWCHWCSKKPWFVSTLTPDHAFLFPRPSPYRRLRLPTPVCVLHTALTYKMETVAAISSSVLAGPTLPPCHHRMLVSKFTLCKRGNKLLRVTTHSCRDSVQAAQAVLYSWAAVILLTQSPKQLD